LFRHFIRARYSQSSEISRNLFTQFASDLDAIATNVLAIPNRLIYAFTSIILFATFGFDIGKSSDQNKGKRQTLIISIIIFMYFFLVLTEVFLFKKATRLSIAARKRYEEDNKFIYERINGLEYIKAVSGEEREEEKVDRKLDTTFRRNKYSLL